MVKRNILINKWFATGVLAFALSLSSVIILYHNDNNTNRATWNNINYYARNIDYNNPNKNINPINLLKDLKIQKNSLNFLILQNSYIEKIYKQQYKTLFVKKQSSISKIENIASDSNSSLKNEVTIINNIVNVVLAHPYNYSKYLTVKKLIMPLPKGSNIMPQENINSNNIFSNSYTIQKNSSLGNLVLESEEQIIGAKTLYSAGKMSNKMLFTGQNSNNLANFKTFSKSENKIVNYSSGINNSENNSNNVENASMISQNNGNNVSYLVNSEYLSNLTSNNNSVLNNGSNGQLGRWNKNNNPYLKKGFFGLEIAAGVLLSITGAIVVGGTIKAIMDKYKTYSRTKEDIAASQVVYNERVIHEAGNGEKTIMQIPTGSTLYKHRFTSFNGDFSASSLSFDSTKTKMLQEFNIVLVKPTEYNNVNVLLSDQQINEMMNDFKNTRISWTKGVLYGESERTMDNIEFAYYTLAFNYFNPSSITHERESLRAFLDDKHNVPHFLKGENSGNYDIWKKAKQNKQHQKDTSATASEEEGSLSHDLSMNINDEENNGRGLEQPAEYDSEPEPEVRSKPRTLTSAPKTDSSVNSVIKTQEQFDRAFEDTSIANMPLHNISATYIYLLPGHPTRITISTNKYKEGLDLIRNTDREKMIRFASSTRKFRAFTRNFNEHEKVDFVYRIISENKANTEVSKNMIINSIRQNKVFLRDYYEQSIQPNKRTEIEVRFNSNFSDMMNIARKHKSGESITNDQIEHYKFCYNDLTEGLYDETLVTEYSQLKVYECLSKASFLKEYKEFFAPARMFAK